MRRKLCAALAFGLLGCTVFDGLSVPAAMLAGPSYLSLDQGARACSLVLRCPRLSEAIARSVGVPASAASFSTCLTWLAGPLPSNRFGIGAQQGLLACVSEAAGCEEALGCVFVEPLAADDARCVGAIGDVCGSDGMLVDCASGLAGRCPSPHWGAGSECRLGLASEGRCALGGCLPEMSAPPRCTSGVYVRCDPATNLKVAQDCRTVGLTCPEGAEGADAQCATEDGVFPCDEPGATTCSPDGTRARACDGSLASEFDCASMGASCVEDEAGARCAAAGEACSPRDSGIDACEGSVISLCVAGRRSTLDCASLGLGCVPPAGDRSGFCG